MPARAACRAAAIGRPHKRPRGWPLSEFGKAFEWVFRVPSSIVGDSAVTALLQKM
jgi:hypothetical protein